MFKGIESKIKNYHITCITIMVILGLLYCLPISNQGYSSQDGWHDQSLFYSNFKFIDKNSYEELSPKLVGPSYFTAAKIVKKITGINYKSSLIALNRITYAASILLLYIIVIYSFNGVLNKKINISLSISTIISIFSTNFYFFSNIPWTHFILSALLIMFILFLLLYNEKSKLVYAILIGLLFFFISQCRTAEFIALSISVFFYLILKLAINILKLKKTDWINVREVYFCIWFILGIIFAYLINYLIVGQKNLVLLQKIGEGRSFIFSQVPYKFIQMFFDPSFMSIYNHTHIAHDLGLLINSFKVWWFPILTQSPLLLSSLLLILLLLVFNFKRLYYILTDPVFFISCSTSIGLIIGYCGADTAGAMSLKYGFIREFISPTLLLTISFFRGCSLVSNMNMNDIKVNNILIYTMLFVFINATLLMAKSFEMHPQITKYHLAEIQAKKKEYENKYGFKVYGLNNNNEQLSIPDYSAIRIEYKNGTIVNKRGRVSKFYIKFKEADEISKITFIPSITGQIGSPLKIEGYAVVNFSSDIIEQKHSKKNEYPILIKGSSTSEILSILGSGWHEPEKTHVWSGAEAELYLPVPEKCQKSKCEAEITLSVYGAGKNRPVDVYFQVNNQNLEGYHPLTARNRGFRKVRVPLTAKGSKQKVSIEIPKATSPKELGESQDSRILGVALRSIELMHHKKDASAKGLKRQEFSADTLLTEVGSFSNGDVVTTGKSGFLVYGTYEPMEAGEYRLILRGKASSLASAWVDVVSGRGKVQHAEFPLSQSEEKDADILLSDELTIESSVKDLEVRVHVGEKDNLRLTGYELRRIDSADR